MQAECLLTMALNQGDQMARNYTTWITTLQNKRHQLAAELTKDGMIDFSMKSLGYLALTVSFIAGVMAIVPAAIWIGCGLLANNLIDGVRE